MAFNNMQSGSDDDMPAMAEINIIPLVDVMLVLLIITMVTAPYLEQGLSVDLPITESGQNLQKGSKEQPVFIFISIEHGIKISGIENKIAKEDVASKLVGLFNGRKDKEVFIKADKSIPYGEVADVMSRVKAAGITKVGLVTLPNQ